MVAGRTNDREGVGHAAGADRIDRAEEPPGGMAGGVERGLSLDRRVAGGEDDEPSGDILRHDPQILRRVDAEQLGVGDRARHERDASVEEAVTLQPVEDGLHPRRRFRVPRPGVMEERGGIGDESGHRYGPRRERGKRRLAIGAPTGPPGGVAGPPKTGVFGGWGGWEEGKKVKFAGKQPCGEMVLGSSGAAIHCKAGKKQF